MSKEVSCKVLDLFFRELRKKGLVPERLASDTGLSVAQLRNKHERIDWATFLTFMSNVGKIWSEDELVQMGSSFFDTPYVRPFSVIARLLFSGPEFYAWVFSKNGIGVQGFNCVEPNVERVNDQRIRLELKLRPGYAPCREFFFVAKGNFTGMPRVLGLPRAQVQMDLTSQGAIYGIDLPPGGGTLGRIRRALLWPFTVRAAAQELREAHGLLTTRYQELEQAKSVLAVQADQLQTVNFLGRELTKHTELKSLGDSVSQLLSERFRCTGQEFWLARRPGETLQSVRQLGQLGPGEPRQFNLTSSGEVIGRIDTWGLQAPTGLVEALIPWISIALDNARNFALLREYQEGLEKKVGERTAELKKTTEQLEHSLQKLTELDRQKTEFFSNASHELRTPLTLLLAPLEALVGSASVPDAARQEIQGSLRSAYRLLKLINDLLDLSKIEAGRMTLRVGPTDLTRILQEVARPWRPALERRNVALVLELPPKLQLVADGERIEQVALNLVSNAVKYVPNGGSLKISARQDGSEAEFVVENSGEGLDPEQVGKLFERFGQSTRSNARRFGSTGLGLPVVRELVELHGGKVTVDNRPGEKVAFCVRLPIGAPIPEAALTEVPLPTSTELLQYEAIAAAPELVSAPEAVKETEERPLLLIAEDNPDVRGFLVRNLKRQFSIVEASDGTQALKLAQERIPALILSDLMMPELDGIELCKALKASPETMGIPFILLTARADLEGKLAGLRAGADDYVIKPFHLEEIKARLTVQLRLKSLAENLAQNEKLAALGVLVAGVAHEIRNPLNGIINALVPLRTVLGDASKETSELLELAISSAGRVDQISLQLLQQARVGEGIRAEVDVASNVALAVQLLSYKIQQGPKLVSDIPQGEKIRVVGEPGALNQVWINLIDNAIQAAGPSGEVRVRVHYDDHLAKVEVVDNGPGIQPQVIKKIFDPFFTTKQVGSGTGLGLALARDIIQKHGGNITVHSKPGSGAHFKVTLPAAGVS